MPKYYHSDYEQLSGSPELSPSPTAQLEQVASSPLPFPIEPEPQIKTEPIDVEENDIIPFADTGSGSFEEAEPVEEDMLADPVAIDSAPVEESSAQRFTEGLRVIRIANMRTIVGERNETDGSGGRVVLPVRHIVRIVPNSSARPKVLSKSGSASPNITLPNTLKVILPPSVKKSDPNFEEIPTVRNIQRSLEAEEAPPPLIDIANQPSLEHSYSQDTPPTLTASEEPPPTPTESALVTPNTNNQDDVAFPTSSVSTEELSNPNMEVDDAVSFLPDEKDFESKAGGARESLAIPSEPIVAPTTNSNSISERDILGELSKVIGYGNMDTTEEAE